MTITFLYKGNPQSDADFMTNISFDRDPDLTIDYEAKFSEVLNCITAYNMEVKYSLIYNLLKTSLITIIDDSDQEIFFYAESGFLVKFCFEEPEEPEEEEVEEEEEEETIEDTDIEEKTSEEVVAENVSSLFPVQDESNATPEPPKVEKKKTGWFKW